MKRRFHPRHGDTSLAAAGAAGNWLYGRHAVEAALANPSRRVRRLIALGDSAPELGTLVAKAQAKLPQSGIETLDRSAFEMLLPQGSVHQGMALSAEPLPEPHLDDILAALPEGGERQIMLLLDKVTDPHNVGAILRSAAAFDVRAVIVPEHGAPAITGTLAKASSGALEAVPLVRVANLSQALEKLKDAGFWCLGLDGDAKQDLATLDLADRVALVLGAEGEGLRRLTKERCDVLVRLRTRGALRSLNVSNAAAVALYEVATRTP